MITPEEQQQKFPSWFNVEKFVQDVGQVYSYFNLRVQRDKKFVQVTPRMELSSSDTLLIKLEEGERSGTLSNTITPIPQLRKALYVVLLESINPQSDTQSLPLADRIHGIREPLCSLFPGDLMEKIIADIEDASRSFPEWFDIVTFHSRLAGIFQDFELQVERKGTFVPARLIMSLSSLHKYRFRVGKQIKEGDINVPEFDPFIAKVREALLKSMTTSSEPPLDDEVVMTHLVALSKPMVNLYRSDFIVNIITIIHSRITQGVLDKRLSQSS